MSKVRIELNEKGMRELLQSEGIDAAIKAKAEEIRANAEASSGEEYHIRQTRTDRVGYVVEAATTAAKKENLENNTLLKCTK